MKKTKNEEPTIKAAPPYQNEVTLVGYLGLSPEPRNGHVVMSLATKSSWKPKEGGDWQERTDWHRIVAWGKLADAVQSLAQGDHVMVQGELRSSEYEREVFIVGGGKAVVATKTWEIRARSIRKLAHKKKPKAQAQPLAKVA